MSWQEYLQNKDSQFKNLERIYKERKRQDKKSNQLKIVLQYMIDEYAKGRIWLWSYEFIGKTNSKGAFLSHRAPARASDLAIKYSLLVEDKKIGNLKVYRLKIENKNEIVNFLTDKGIYK